MQAFNQLTANLQTKILQLDAASAESGKQLNLAIINAEQLLHEIRAQTKAMSGSALHDFLGANLVILQQLKFVVTTTDENNPLLTKSAAITQQIATMYQDAIVPMLSRLHNMSSEAEDMQKITAITSLGNEIITYSAQMNQFSEKFSIAEKIIALFGIVLLLSSILMIVAILSKPTLEIPISSALITMALGCNVCSKAMQLHEQDPSTDLIITSVKKMEPLILEITKNYPQNQDDIKALLTYNAIATVKPKVSAKPQPPVEPSTTHKPRVAEPSTAEATETEISEGNVKLMDRLKGVLDLFNTKK